MIQVSSGSRSRSPFSPLSLRMMSRADLKRLPSAWAVVGAGPLVDFVGLRGIEFILQFGYGRPKLIGAAEEADDFGDLAMVGDRGNPKHVRQHKLRVAMLGIFFE